MSCDRLNSITVNTFGALFNCTPAGLASNLIKAPAEKLGLDLSALPMVNGVQLLEVFCSSVSVLVLMLRNR